jgi:hypothetical protein
MFLASFGAKFGYIFVVPLKKFLLNHAKRKERKVAIKVSDSLVEFKEENQIYISSDYSKLKTE